MMCHSCLTFQIDPQKAKMCMKLKKQANTYSLIMFFQYLIPLTCYNWESTVLCAGSQYCLTSTDLTPTINRSVSDSYWCSFTCEHEDGLRKISHPCKICMQGVVAGPGYLQCCRFFCLLNHTYLSKLCDILKTLLFGNS